MLYKFSCDFDSNGNPIMYLRAWNIYENQVISHYCVAKEGIPRYTERRLTHTNRGHKKTNKGTDVPLLQWEFNIKTYILSFMNSTLSPFNHAKTILEKEARKAKPNISIEKIL